MALPTIISDTSNRTLGELIAWTTREDGYFPIELNPPYQRGSVWTQEQQMNLIKSVLQELPIGVIFINHRDTNTYSTPPRMVDGQQRALALMAFTNDEFSIPTEWVDDREDKSLWDSDGISYPSIPEDYAEPTISYSKMTPRGQRSFRNGTVAVYETYLPTEAEEAELFRLINFGGVAQTPEDQARAKRVAAA